jgi:hypothetical protein
MVSFESRQVPFAEIETMTDQDDKSFTLAAIQAAPIWGDTGASLDKACAWIERAGAAHTDLAGSGEVWLPGYPFFHRKLNTPAAFEAAVSYVANAGLEKVEARAVSLALPGEHPFWHWPIESTMATRARTKEWGLIPDDEWEQMVAECERIAGDRDIFLISFMVIQIWGRKLG